MVDGGGLVKNELRQNLIARQSDATALLRAAAIVRYGRDIGDHIDANAKRCQRTNRRLATRTRAFDLDVKVFNALFNRCATRNFRRHLGGKRCRFAGALKALST